MFATAILALIAAVAMAWYANVVEHADQTPVDRRSVIPSNPPSQPGATANFIPSNTAFPEFRGKYLPPNSREGAGTGTPVRSAAVPVPMRMAATGSSNVIVTLWDQCGFKGNSLTVTFDNDLQTVYYYGKSPYDGSDLGFDNRVMSVQLGQPGVTFDLFTEPDLQGDQFVVTSDVPCLPLYFQNRTTSHRLRNIDFSYLGGPVMSSANVYLIFYGTWAQAKVGLIQHFIQNVEASAWFRISKKYGSNKVALANVTFDNYSRGKNLASDWGESDVQAIIHSSIAKNKWKYDVNAIYFVLTSSDVSVEGFLDRYCGWHNYFIQNDPVTGKDLPIKYAFQGESPLEDWRCTAYAPTSPNALPTVDTLINGIAHELSGTMTNPEFDAWTGSDGEKSDLCAWLFPFFAKRASNDSYHSEVIDRRNYLIQTTFDPESFQCAGGQSICSDNLPQCAEWVRAGYCGYGKSTYYFMNRNCAKSCRICGGNTYSPSTVFVQWFADNYATVELWSVNNQQNPTLIASRTGTASDQWSTMFALTAQNLYPGRYRVIVKSTNLAGPGGVFLRVIRQSFLNKNSTLLSTVTTASWKLICNNTQNTPANRQIWANCGYENYNSTGISATAVYLTNATNWNTVIAPQFGRTFQGISYGPLSVSSVAQFAFGAEFNIAVSPVL